MLTRKSVVSIVSPFVHIQFKSPIPPYSYAHLSYILPIPIVFRSLQMPVHTLNGGLRAGGGQSTHSSDHEVLKQKVVVGILSALAPVVAEIWNLGGIIGSAWLGEWALEGWRGLVWVGLLDGGGRESADGARGAWNSAQKRPRRCCENHGV